MNVTERLQRSESALQEITAKICKPKAKAKVKASCCIELDCGEEECDTESESEMDDCASKDDIEWLNQRINWLNEDLQYYRQAFYSHMDGHLPKIVGVDKMNSALKALGLDGEYKVEPKIIYANDGSVSSVQFSISAP